MYLKKIHIQNIKSIKDFEMEFDEPAGWHVLIGDNGTGKSTIVKGISLAFVGDPQALRINWEDWLRQTQVQGSIELLLSPSPEDSNHQVPLREGELAAISDKKISFKLQRESSQISFRSVNWLAASVQSSSKGWFSAAFGPFRRFEGGNHELSKLFKIDPILGAHLSAFGEDVALTEALEWLKLLKYQALEKHPDSFQLDCIKALVNSPDFLPNGMRLERISSEGVQFTNEADELLPVGLLSDGYRSILSMTFELIRQMVWSYSPKDVFKNILNGEMTIDLPGVVLIDEIDVHLHPNWQTRIGQWFTKYFPRIQFIVTTHSPLICRACEKGSIWRLVGPESSKKSGRVSEIDANRLIHGNILDAYGTEVFGAEAVRTAKSDEKLSRLGRLNMLYAYGKITEQEEKERRELQLIFTTDDPTGY